MCDLHVSTLVRRLRAELAEGCAAARLPLPRLLVEPERAVAGPAGIALYRVLAVKHTSEKVFAAVDDGMSDNPRPPCTERATRPVSSAAAQRPPVRSPGWAGTARPTACSSYRWPSPTTCPWPAGTTSSAARRRGGP